MVLGSVTVGLAAVVLLRPRAGLQLYTAPGRGVPPSGVEARPGQMVRSAPASATGGGVTVTVKVAVFEQVPSVPVTVYTVVVVGDTVMLVAVEVWPPPVQL